MKNMEDDYNDAEQVFVINEEQTESHRVVERSNIELNLDEESSLALIKYGFIGFILICIIAGIAKAFVSNGNGSIVIPFLFIIISTSIYIFINSGKKCINKINNQTKVLNNRSLVLKHNRIANNPNKKRKKFNNIEEYKNSNQFKIDEAHKEREKNDNIELAVEALLRLGFAKKKAVDWVGRGIASGIQHSDTQRLVKYALGRGTIIN